LASVIVSTYDQPESLRMCLWGLHAQRQRQFEILVADDGSDEHTRRVLMGGEFRHLRIRHLWQPDHGFRRSRAVNWAISVAQSPYLIFIDSDCVPRADFIEQHLRWRRPGRFISAGRIHIPEAVHRGFTARDVITQRIFDPAFLGAQCRYLRRYRLRLSPGRGERILNALTHRRGVFHGSNASCWREDAIRVNGFNESFTCGSDDREFGARLWNAGVRSRWLKFSLLQIHLDHVVRYGDGQAQENRQRFKQIWRAGISHTEPGVDTAAERVAKELALNETASRVA
jgi:glycosyltransferase involved in cell wall biosynthesis